MIVYKLTNKINGKVYIGITTKGLEKRIRNHWNHAKFGIHRPLYTAMRKYGLDSFESTILAIPNSIEEMKALEIYFIESHGSTSREKGYNVTLGGEGAYGARHSPEVREFLSRKAKERGTSHLIDAYKAAWLDPVKREAMTEQRKGRVWSEETREKSIAARTGQKRGRTAQTEKMEAVMAVRCGPEHKSVLVQRGGKPVCIFCERRRKRESRERKAAPVMV
jgi:group I intron endonuclease